MNLGAKFYAAGFILSGEIRNRTYTTNQPIQPSPTNQQTKTVNDIFIIDMSIMSDDGQ